MTAGSEDNPDRETSISNVQSRNVQKPDRIAGSNCSSNLLGDKWDTRM